MKKIIRNWFAGLLGLLARGVIRRSGATVIAITGSVGKTTTKEAVAAVLSTTFPIRKTEGNYNTEIGLPLSVLGQRVGKGLLSWLRVSLSCLVASLSKQSFKYIVLEMGADQPRDIAHLTKVIKPDIGIVTAVARVHLDENQFPDERAIQREKSEMVRCLTEHDQALLNADNPLVVEMKEWTKAQIFFYGKDLLSETRLIVSLREQGAIQNLEGSAEDSQPLQQGIQFVLRYEDQKYQFFIPVLSESLISSFLPAIVIGLQEGVPVEKIQKALSGFTLPNGRFNLLPGINESLIIDSSYNASPFAVIDSLQSFSKVPAKRRIAVLGTMNELGKYSEEEHKRVGREAADRCDLLLTLGEHAKYIALQAQEKNPKLEIHSFLVRDKLSQFLKQNIQEGNLMLFKGSQNGVFLEEVIKDVMLHPEQASDILVRQGPEWEGKKS